MKSITMNACYFETKHKNRWFYHFVKRSFDILVSSLFIILLSWLYLILAICVKVSDGGPVFFAHERMGKNGKKIRLLKFRSMKVGADKLSSSLTPEQQREYEKEFKLQDDPRITKLGKFMRKTSLDELPNMFAVFKGDISLIGCRPLTEDEVNQKYGASGEKLLSEKPGIIGWWAVNGRSNCVYETGARQILELYYIDNCSIKLDIKILFKSVVTVFKRDGAI